MSSGQLLLTSDLGSHLPLVNRGKVRDIYNVDEGTLLLVTTDRISAFDVALANGVPNKGAILTLLTAHWAKVLCNSIPSLRTHVLTLNLPSNIPAALQDTYQNRSMQARKLIPFKIEAIVRGRLTREAWDSYRKDTTVCGIKIAPGLKEGEAFPNGPIYTPSTKADVGEHDEDISEAQATKIVGTKYANRIKELSIQVFQVAAEYARERGLILVDTKFEFGLDTETGEVVLMDEILTPESSRFWRVEEGFRVGEEELENIDKQCLRDWLVGNGLDGKDGVVLPEVVVEKIEEMYKEAFRRLVGKSFQEVVGF
ncbi:MAG: hypothetical protein Q9178_002172 [Gyalolechia marmorata]